MVSIEPNKYYKVSNHYSYWIIKVDYIIDITADCYYIYCEVIITNNRLWTKEMLSTKRRLPINSSDKVELLNENDIEIYRTLYG